VDSRETATARSAQPQRPGAKQPLRVPRADPLLIPRLRERLAEVGFSDEGIRRAWNVEMGSDPWSLAAVQPASDGSPFSAVVTLLWSGTPVEARRLEAALAPLRLLDLERLGLVEIRDRLAHPLCLVRPAGPLMVASDLPAVGADPVLGVVPASETLANLTVRRRGGRALDLGTGCGVQALLLARDHEAVVAVDVNPRALAFARFNAALNGAANLEPREGRWFAPVEDERFETVACNPPFVISPDVTYTYRDGGLPRDAVSRMVVREAARHLADGGFATILCNWIHDDAWADPLRSWVADAGCDALLLHYASVDPVSYAARWNAELQGRAPAIFDATVRRWVDHYRAEGIARIGFGAVILRRRAGAKSWVRALDMATGPTCASSDHVLRLFEGADFLESSPGGDLLRQAFRLVDGHRVDQTLAYQGETYRVGPAVFRCVPGIGLEAPVDPRALEVLLDCDGRRPLAELVREAMVRRGDGGGSLATLVEGAVRLLVERGFMTAILEERKEEEKGEREC
jgi:methylase of polypeptide subunit release factors